MLLMEVDSLVKPVDQMPNLYLKYTNIFYYIKSV